MRNTCKYEKGNDINMSINNNNRNNYCTKNEVFH